MNELTIEVEGGALAVIDHGGEPDAVPVLLVHSLGNCAATWQFVAPRLGSTIHAYAYDLPGHGHSTAQVDTFDNAWRHIVTLTRALGLQRPLLVAHDRATMLCSLAAMEAPDLFRGVVSFGGALLIDHEKCREEVEFAVSPAFGRILRERFLFGATGSTHAQAQELIDNLVGRGARDWLLAGMRDGLRAEVKRSMRYLPDGSWLHKPTVESVQTMVSIPDERPITPGPWFYDRLAVPLWTVQLGEGYETLTPEGAEFIAEHPLLRYAFLEANAWPQYDKPERVAAIIEQIALDPAARSLALAQPCRV